MTSLMQDIEIVQSELITPAYKIRITNNWRDDLSLAVDHSSIWKDDAMVAEKYPQIAQVIGAKTTLSIHPKTGEAVLVTSKRGSDDIFQSVIYQIRSDINDFIRLHAGYSNYRLSALYKWFSSLDLNSSTNRYLFLIEDLYALYKYIQGSGVHNKNSVHTQNAVKLLHIIKDRYESKV